jgi:hypothetical protein
LEIIRIGALEIRLPQDKHGTRGSLDMFELIVARACPSRMILKAGRRR